MNSFLREQRLYNNGLNKSFKDAAEVSKNLLGVQCQLHYYAMISIFNRTKHQTIPSISKNNHLLKSWGQRTTHHLYHKDDFATINQHLQMDSLWPKKHISDTDEVIRILKDFTDQHDSFTKEELFAQFPTSTHESLNIWSALVILGCSQGLTYVDVLENNTKKYRSAKTIPNVPKDMEYILKQYFTYYGPATVQDFAHWSGLPLKRFIGVFNEIKDSLYCTNSIYFSTSQPTKKKIHYPIILGKFDPLLLSYKDKSWILGEFDSSIIWRKAAHVEGVIIDETGLSATWHYTLKAKRIIFNIKPLFEIDPKTITPKFQALMSFMNKDEMTLEIELPYVKK